MEEEDVTAGGAAAEEQKEDEEGEGEEESGGGAAAHSLVSSLIWQEDREEEALRDRLHVTCLIYNQQLQQLLADVWNRLNQKQKKAVGSHSFSSSLPTPHCFS